MIEAGTGLREEIERFGARFLAARTRIKLRGHGRGEEKPKSEEDSDTAHGSFDNDIEVMSATLRRIRGSTLLQPIGSLVGF